MSLSEKARVLFHPQPHPALPAKASTVEIIVEEMAFSETQDPQVKL